MNKSIESTDTFHKDDSFESLYSSPRQRINKEILAENRVMPFDFVTNRKARTFFKEDAVNIDTLLNNQDLSNKQNDTIYNPG